MTETNYTIVEPKFELFEPCTSENYMEFLEICVRNCYKSEDKIGEGTAAKLLKKVVNDFGHFSVVEHASCIMKLTHPDPEGLLLGWIDLNPLFGHRATLEDDGQILISGNVRMWMELMPYLPTCPFSTSIRQLLHQEWPFFFDMPENPVENTAKHAELNDNNPYTNKDELTEEQMLKHMTLTGRFIGSRSMSHQLVRHRLAAYSQESQRYCNYGKKGFQFIIPPSIKMKREMAPIYTMGNDDPKYDKINWDPYHKFIESVKIAYKQYLELIDAGVKPEDARELLPNACKTEVIATYTLGMWRHLVHHRGHNKKAQWQIRDMVLDAEKAMDKRLPFKIYGG